MRKKTVCVFLAFVFFLLGTAAIAVEIVIPERINLIAGSQQSICYNVPLRAVLYNEENIRVSGMETEPVKENIVIDLNKPTIVTPTQEGTATAEISAFGIPLKKVSVNILPKTKVITCGKVVGVVMKTEGVLVLGIGNVKNDEGKIIKPSDGIIKTGDIIVSCNGTAVTQKEELKAAVSATEGNALNLEVKRNSNVMDVEITPAQNEYGEYKIGAWVRDSTQGLGTVTFIDPNSGEFAALGHGVYDVDTKELMSVSEGVVTLSELSGIKKGESGEPGEIIGKLDKENIVGEISKNSNSGIFGTMNSSGIKELDGEELEVGLMQDVTEGSAVIRSDVVDGVVKDYTINIESISKFGSGVDKGMVISVTDDRLIQATGGIIQGMSGSPIIQNGKLIGAVTHVFVKDSKKGYGIFVENMLK
ncbi:MAG TPA: SpoIVB peptidase [Lachnospiraceae bacterium]|nr:SpoIVB peptidase [Lachnospiraceae bacterium]